MSHCCLKGFEWDGKPEGKEGKLAGLDTYVTGGNKDVAILIVHDLFGWTLPNVRLLADHYAKETDATVFMPDFFHGDVVSTEVFKEPAKFPNFNMQIFLDRHSKDKRLPEIVATAKELKQERGFKKIGAVGYCWGGWAVFQLGAKGNNLVDAISTAHPSLLTKEEINAVAVPVQIIAPEHDPAFTPELKAHANSVIPGLGVEYDYQLFPGVEHGFSTKCDRNDSHQRKSMERAKNAVVAWFAQILHLQ